MPAVGARGAAFIAGAALGAGPLAGAPFGGAPPTLFCAAAGSDSAATIATAGIVTVRNLILPMPEVLLLFLAAGVPSAATTAPLVSALRRGQLWQSKRGFPSIYAVLQPQFRQAGSKPI